MSEEQAVLVYLDGTTLPKEVYEQHDLATLEDQLIAVIDPDGLGEFDGNEIGPTETTLYMYGPNAAPLVNGIEPVLRASPFCQNAKVVIRLSSPGASVTQALISMRP